MSQPCNGNVFLLLVRSVSPYLAFLSFRRWHFMVMYTFLQKTSYILALINFISSQEKLLPIEVLMGESSLLPKGVIL
ncbi:hypothetical protein N9X09_03680 [Flavobacteriaceae bacterium]|nr:hypothetical protein [Flavobacteriaceae bacterium]